MITTNGPILVFGGGPAGLMAADVLSAAGHAVSLYEAMPTVGRKFLLAGKSGLNLTHSEELENFIGRYGNARSVLEEAVRQRTPQAVRQWADELGGDTFVGTSGRVFPRAMKASPLLRAWIRKLEAQGVRIHVRHRWSGLGPDGRHHILGPEGEVTVDAPAALLAFGGASWPKLGSDGGWVSALEKCGVTIHPFRPANCGFERRWSDYLVEHFAGAPIKSVMASSSAGTRQGEFVISKSGIEGSLVYAHAAALRDEIDRDGTAVLTLDMAPGRDRISLAQAIEKQGVKTSLSNRLRKGAGLDAAKIALLREICPDLAALTPAQLASRIKSLPVVLEKARPLAEAISSAGGVAWDEIDASYMLKKVPGLFVAGEMIDWEAPTGGYLLTACLATGDAAGRGMARWLAR